MERNPQRLVLNSKSITYDGKTTSSWGVDTKKDTQFGIDNCGEIRDVTVNGGSLYNYDGGVISNLTVNGGGHYNDQGCTIDKAILDGGTLTNRGYVKEAYVCGGTLENYGYIETLYFWYGAMKPWGYIGEIIYINAPSAGMDEAEFDAGYVNEGMVADPIIILDDADWQDAAPLGEEAMVW